MADLVSILREIRGEYSDRARDRLPDGSVWESIDWVPLTMQAGVRMRGAWHYHSPPLAAAPDGMAYTPYRDGPKLLVIAGGRLYDVPINTTTTRGVEALAIGATDVGAAPATLQNPAFHRERLIIPAADGTTQARYVTWTAAGGFVLNDAPATAIPGRYAAMWKDRTVLAGSEAEPDMVAISQPGDPTIAWDELGQLHTSFAVTGLASQRTQILIFHASSVERLRGTIIPDSGLPPSEQEGDLILDFLFARAGCYDARSIAYWGENVLFADGRGIHMTDGAVVRNIAYQAGVLNLWYAAFDRGGPPLTIAGVVHQDYYICTVRNTGYPPVTFVSDLQNRRVFRLANVDSGAYAYSIGVGEQFYGTDHKTARVIDCTPFFKPDPTVFQVDDDGKPVLPILSTGFASLTGKVGFKRLFDMHLDYEAHRDDGADVFRVSYVNSPTGENQRLGEFKSSSVYTRRKIGVRRRLPGFGTHIEQLVPTRDSRLYDISVRTAPEEASKL